MLNEQISENFKLSELVVTNTGLDNIPSDPKIIAALRNLVLNGLQPLRDIIGLPIIVNSGYRSDMVNFAVGGAETSQHKRGEAADIKVKGMEPIDLARVIISNGLPYDQLIVEQSGSAKWLHWSIKLDGVDRRQTLNYLNGVYTKTYLS